MVLDIWGKLSTRSPTFDALLIPWHSALRVFDFFFLFSASTCPYLFQVLPGKPEVISRHCWIFAETWRGTELALKERLYWSNHFLWEHVLYENKAKVIAKLVKENIWATVWTSSFLKCHTLPTASATIHSLWKLLFNAIVVKHRQCRASTSFPVKSREKGRTGSPKK